MSQAIVDCLEPFPDFDVDRVDGLLQEGVAYLDELAEAQRLDPTMSSARSSTPKPTTVGSTVSRSSRW